MSSPAKRISVVLAIQRAAALMALTFVLLSAPSAALADPPQKPLPPSSAPDASDDDSALGSSVEQDIIQQLSDKISEEAVIALGAIVNCLDKAHFQKVLHHFVSVALATAVPITEFVCVGKPADFIHLQGSSDMKKLTLLGGRLVAQKEVPPEFPVQYSPTWIVHTRDDVYILEGTGLMSEVLNKKGRYVGFGERAVHVSGKKLPPPPKKNWPSH